MIEFHYEKIPSVNDTYFCTQDRVIKKNEVREYQTTLSCFCSLQAREYRCLFLKEKLEIELVFGVKNKNRDLDNMIKATLDAMQGVLFKNDCQIYRLVVEKEISKKPYEYVLIDIKELRL